MFGLVLWSCLFLVQEQIREGSAEYTVELQLIELNRTNPRMTDQAPNFPIAPGFSFGRYKSDAQVKAAISQALGTSKVVRKIKASALSGKPVSVEATIGTTTLSLDVTLQQGIGQKLRVEVEPGITRIVNLGPEEQRCRTVVEMMSGESIVIGGLTSSTLLSIPIEVRKTVSMLGFPAAALPKGIEINIETNFVVKVEKKRR